MTTPTQPNPPEHGQLLVYAAEDGKLKLDVRLEDETAWLMQAQMASLFQTTIPSVSMHLRNVFAEGELQPLATVKEFLIVRQEGNRQVSRSVEHFNLDAIISVGYRVKSAVATRPLTKGVEVETNASGCSRSLVGKPAVFWPCTGCRAW